MKISIDRNGITSSLNDTPLKINHIKGDNWEDYEILDFDSEELLTFYKVFGEDSYYLSGKS